MPTSPDITLERCPRCGASVSEHARAGFCSQCLAAVSLVDAEAAPASDDELAAVLPRSALAAGRRTRFGDYELLEEIARGGMGVVYRARQRSLNRIVAIKTLLFGGFAGEEGLRRFRLEAASASALEHPNIVRILDVGDHDGQPFLAMDYVAGRDLARLVSERPLLARQAAGYVEKIARAVEFAHQRGILHRDLKSSNVLIDAFDEPRVTDFGLAKRLGVRQSSGALDDVPLPAEAVKDAAAPSSVASESGRGLPQSKTSRTSEPLSTTSDSQLSTQDPLNSLTRTGQPLGSPGFMPPEQAEGDGRRIGPASDVYGLGAILYHLLTSRPPFLADTFEATLRQVLDRDPIPLRQFNPNVPADLETICLKCLEKEPAKRYPTAQALADELNRFLRDEPIHARPVGRIEKAWRWCRRKPALAASLSAILLLLLLVIVGSPIAAYRIDRERQRAEQQSTRAEANAANERRERYYASIAAADSHIRNGDIDVALSVLTNCPPEFRHWEWGRLLYLCHQSISTTKLPSGSAEVLNVNATATRAVAVKSLRTAQRAACWDLIDGRELFEVASEANLVVATAFSPDGERLAVALLNGLVTIWHAQSGQDLARYQSTKEINALQFNGTGTHLALSCVSGAGRLVDAASGKLLLARPESGVRFRSGALDPSGRFWATMDDDALVTVRDARTGEARFQFQGFADVNITAFRFQPLLAFSPDGSRLVAHASEKSAKVWNTETGRELLFIPSKVFGLAFDGDVKQVAIFSGGKTAELWNLVTGEKSQTVHAHRRRVNFVGFDRSGALLRTGCEEGLLKTWPATPGREWIAHPFRVDSVEFSPDGGRFVTTQLDGLGKVWETDSARERLAFRANWSWARAASFSPDGKRIVTGGADRCARVFDAETGREVMVMKGHTSAVRSAVFSPDGRKIATASWDKTVRLWDAGTGLELFTLRGHSDSVRFAAFSPDGARLTSVAQDSKIHVWETATGRSLMTLAGGNSAGAISRNGRRVATGSFSGSIRLWDGDTGQLLAKWSARAGIQALDFSPDGKRLLVVASDSTGEFIQPSLEIWDVEAGRQVLVLSGHPAMVLGAKFSPDGRRILTGSAAYGVRLWEAFPWEERFYPDTQATDRGSPDPQRVEPVGTPQRFPTFSPPQRAAAQESRDPGKSTTPLLDRIKAHAETYWSARLKAEELGRAANSNLPPVEPLRFPQSVWPMRDPAAGRNQIDLSAHYNTPLNLPDGIVTHESLYDDDLSDLPTGLVTFADQTFDVRGMVCLASATNAYLRGAVSVQRHPSIQGIPVGYPARRIHLLHTMARESGAGIPSDGTLLCRYILHYADGTRHELPVLYGRDVRECWERDDDIKPETDRGVVVWRGTNPAVADRGGRLRIYLRTFENPRPEVEIKAVDLISAHPPCVPILIALTIEP